MQFNRIIYNFSNIHGLIHVDSHKTKQPSENNHILSFLTYAGSIIGLLIPLGTLWRSAVIKNYYLVDIRITIILFPVIVSAILIYFLCSKKITKTRCTTIITSLLLLLIISLFSILNAFMFRFAYRIGGNGVVNENNINVLQQLSDRGYKPALNDLREYYEIKIDAIETE